MGFGSMYALTRSWYTPLAPGLAIPVEAFGRIGFVLAKYGNGDLPLDDTIEATAKILYEMTDQLVHVLPDISDKDDTGRPMRNERESRKEREERK